MNKDKIISEIKRTAAENGGVALGQGRFAKATGIAKHTWHGKYWRSWTEAVIESGFVENKFTAALDKTSLVLHLAKLTRKIGRFPSEVDLKIARTADETFPSTRPFWNTLGAQHDRIELIRKYAIQNAEYSDILKFLPEAAIKEETTSSADTKAREGSVYLAKGVKGYYKIGKTINADFRMKTLSAEGPEKVELIHTINTDDADGIEAYWHKRFKDKHTNGEWFKLTREHIQAFKKRKFM